MNLVSLGGTNFNKQDLAQAVGFGERADILYSLCQVNISHRIRKSCNGGLGEAPRAINLANKLKTQIIDRLFIK